MNHKKLTFASVCLALLACCASAQDLKTEKVLEGLNRPASLAFHPLDNSIYIAEFGANRIVKIADGKPQEVIGGFSPLSHSRMDSEGGPASIEFLNPNWMLVGTGEEADSPFQLHGYDLSTIEDGQPLAASETHAILDIGETDSKMNGHVTGMVLGSASVLVCGLESSGKSFLASIAKSDAKPDTIGLLHPAKQDADQWLDSSQAMTISVPEGYLAFVQIDDSGSKLTFFSEDGEANGTFDTGLKKVTAMAYGPNRGRLYLADRETSAIYKLIESDNDSGCESVKVHEVANVTDMRFNSAGELLVASLGETIGDDSGQILKLIGLDTVKEDTKEGE